MSDAKVDRPKNMRHANESMKVLIRKIGGTAYDEPKSPRQA